MTVVSTRDKRAAPSGTAEQSAPIAPPRPRRSRRTREYLVFLAFAGPNLLLIALFTYRPLLTNVYYSTLDWNLGSRTATPVGFFSPQARSIPRKVVTSTP